MYNGAGKVPPAPLSATTGVEAVVVGAGVVVVVAVVLVDVEVVVREVVTIGVVAAEFVVVAIDWVVEVGWVVVMEVVVALLQEVKTKAVISSIDVRTMIHFLLNLFNNSIFSFSLFTFIMKGHL